jgi:hypothetical protein
MGVVSTLLFVFSDRAMQELLILHTNAIRWMHLSNEQVLSSIPVPNLITLRPWVRLERHVLILASGPLLSLLGTKQVDGIDSLKPSDSE